MTTFAARMQRVTAVQMAWVTVAILLVLLLVTQNGLVFVAVLGYGVWLLVATMRRLPVSTSPTTDTLSAAVFSPMTFITDASISTNDTVDGLVRASQAINEVTLMQSDSAREQAQVIQVANARLDDFLAMTERVSDQARLVTRMATQAATISDSGQDAIQQTIVSMDDIRTQVEAIGKTIVRLAELTRRIDDIITSVSEIATQSNLLALNASIEAARAGVHGRGFTAVADEVRVLAGQSTQSAEQVRVILVEIQTAMRDTVKATQQGMQNVEIGLTRTHTAQTVMTQLATSVGESRRSIVEISQVLQQQALGMEEISISMDRIQRITQQSLDSTRTVEMVSGNLSRLANNLVTVTG